MAAVQPPGPALESGRLTPPIDRPVAERHRAPQPVLRTPQ